MQPYEVKVAPEDVTDTVNRGMAQGWRFLDSRMLPDGKMMLVFDVSGGIVPKQQSRQAQPYKQSTFHRTCTVVTAGIAALFISLIVFIVAIGGLGVDPTPTHSPGSVQATIRPSGPLPAPVEPVNVDAASLIKEYLGVANYPAHDVSIRGNMLIVNAPASSDDFDDVTDYRFKYIGAVTGASIRAYADSRVVSSHPATIQINFTHGSAVEVRVTLQYSDAVAFLNGTLTGNQFMNRWQVE